jgi:formate C-acetyltransferase
MAAGAPLDLRISKRGLEGEEGINRIYGLIKTFIALGGNMLTLTVTDAEELKKAITEPDKYRNLRVWMGGWTAFFTLLSKEAQAIHLKRTEHGL